MFLYARKFLPRWFNAWPILSFNGWWTDIGLEKFGLVHEASTLAETYQVDLVILQMLNFLFGALWADVDVTDFLTRSVYRILTFYVRSGIFLGMTNQL